MHLHLPMKFLSVLVRHNLQMEIKPKRAKLQFNTQQTACTLHSLCTRSRVKLLKFAVNIRKHLHFKFANLSLHIKTTQQMSHHHHE